MIYCVEDDGSILQMMLYALSASGFEARGFEDGSAFLQAVAQEKPELVLLDVMLPGIDGIEVLKRLRSNPATAQLPVIMATARTTEFDRVIGLDLGADDYLCKPFGMMEMVSRVRAVLRRTKPMEEKVLSVGRLTLDRVAHEVRVDGQRAELTLKEYEMLRLFLENPGKAFSRDELLDRIWDTDYVGQTRTVDVHIASLRTKLGDCGVAIRTLRGVGYRLEEG